MDIQINNHTTLREIHAAFHGKYPYLDIAFFSKKHKQGEASSKSERLLLGITLSEAGDAHKIGSLHLHNAMTVAELEKDLEEQFGLHAQVLRKSGSVWLQTTKSDHLTLHDLNKEAEEVNNFVPDKEVPTGFREQI